jgi:tyrosine-protein kinase Etk/Wzc
MAGYAHGTESIRLGLLDVPPALEGQALTLVATAGGFALQDPDGNTLAEGKVGETLTWGEGDNAGRVVVHTLHAQPGAHFILVSRNHQAVVENLQAQLNIAEKGRQSGVISITLQGNDPDEITQILRAVGNNYVRQNVERKAAEADKSLLFLNEFLPSLKKQLESSETAFNQFRNQKGTFDLSTEGQLALKSSVDLQTQLLTLQQKRRELSSQFTALHPTVQVIDAQIATLNKEIAGITSRVKVLPNVEQDLLRLTRDVKVNSELYLNLLNSAQQLRLVREGKVGNVRVVDQAVAQSTPVAPKRPMIVALSALLGLLGGVALAFARNAMNAGSKTVRRSKATPASTCLPPCPTARRRASCMKASPAKRRVNICWRFPMRKIPALKACAACAPPCSLRCWMPATTWSCSPGPHRPLASRLFLPTSLLCWARVENVCCCWMRTCAKVISISTLA